MPILRTDAPTHKPGDMRCPKKEPQPTEILDAVVSVLWSKLNMITTRVNTAYKNIHGPAFQV